MTEFSAVPAYNPILVPKSEESALPQMQTGREVIISRGPWPADGADDAVEIMFDERSTSPYALHLDARAFDRLPARQDEGRADLLAIVYVGGATDQPREVLRLPARYRRVPRLPWMKEW